MRRFLTAALVLCALAVVFIDLQAAEESAGAVVPINVRIQCDGEDVSEWSVVPDTARLSKSGGDTANFRLVGSPTVETVQVEPKGDDEWPFVDDPPAFGRGNNASTGTIRSDIATGSYRYNLVVTCGSTRVVLDPKMDIDP